MKGIEDTISKKKGNHYIIEGDIVKIELERKNKDNLFAIIDLKNYEKVKNYPYTWHATYSKKIKGYYCVANEYFWTDKGEYKHRTYYLHIFIANPDENPNVCIDHQNHDTLDDRESNLRYTNKVDNSTHRNGKNSNNTTGYRNVIFTENLYVVNLQINGKCTRMGSFKDVHKAGEFAEKMRQKYYGEFAGNG